MDGVTPEDKIAEMGGRVLEFPPFASPGRSPPLRLLTPADCRSAPRRKPLVKGLLARSDLALLIGGPGTGKSLFAPLLAFHVSTGRWFFDHRVKGGPVLYIPAEDGAGMMARVSALMQRFGDFDDFYVAPNALNLSDADDLADLITTIRYIRAALVIIDTMARAFPGLAENEAEDMGRAIAALRHVTAEGPAVLLLHHTPKAGTTARGHGSLEGDADVIMAIERDEDGCRVVTVRKNRNGAEGERLTFTVEVEKLGQDEDGDDVNAPVAMPTIQIPAGAAPKLDRRMPDNARIALDKLHNAVIDHGELLRTADGFPSGRTIGVPLETWRPAVYAALSHLDTPDAKRKAFNRSVEWLQAHGIIGTHDGWVWTVSQT